MTKVVDLHPPISTPKVIAADVPGGFAMNVAGIIEMARTGDSPQCRALARFYAAEYRALDGSPAAHAERELQAFRSAWARLVRKFGVAPIQWEGTRWEGA